MLYGCAVDHVLPATPANDDRNHTTVGPSAPPDKWHRADIETVRLPADAFPDLPTNVVADLNRRGCAIPQPWTADEQANVVYGRFTDPDQTDLAVLCSVERVSSILVYRTSSTDDVAEVGTLPDRGFLQDVGGDHIGFSRQIYVADPKYIRDKHADYGGPAPPNTQLDGIEDAFNEKGSLVWYWHDGKWLELTGSD